MEQRTASVPNSLDISESSLIQTGSSLDMDQTARHASEEPGSTGKWLGVLTRFAESAPGITDRILQMVSSRHGVWFATRIAANGLYFLPRLGPTRRERLVDRFLELLQQHRPSSPPRTGEYTMADELSGIHFRRDQMLWLLQYLNNLPRERKARIASLLVYSFTQGFKRRLANRRAFIEGRPPLNYRLLFMTTAGRCNLDCPGCFGLPELGEKYLTFSRLAYVLAETERVGIRGIYISGWGEPFYDLHDKQIIYQLAYRHAGIFFSIFTNGTTLTEEDLDTIGRRGNLFLYLSLDGLEQTHDSRRGQGVFKQVEWTARGLQRRGIPFGVSATVTCNNYREVTSLEFVDTAQSWGASWIIYFYYFHLFGQPYDRQLDLTAEQASEYYQRLAATGALRPIPLLDIDEAERNVGCRSRKGISTFVDALTGGVAPCIKFPNTTPSLNLYEAPSVGKLEQILMSDAYLKYWDEFPESWHCDVVCSGRKK